MVKRLAILLVLCMAVTVPMAEAQVKTPGNDFHPEPGWTPEFTRGMLALRRHDQQAAFHAFREGADTGKDPNSEYYLAIMYFTLGDMPNYKIWLNKAAQKGQPEAITMKRVQEMFR